MEIGSGVIDIREKYKKHKGQGSLGNDIYVLHGSDQITYKLAIDTSKSQFKESGDMESYFYYGINEYMCPLHIYHSI